MSSKKISLSDELRRAVHLAALKLLDPDLTIWVQDDEQYRAKPHFTPDCLELLTRIPRPVRFADWAAMWATSPTSVMTCVECRSAGEAFVAPLMSAQTRFTGDQELRSVFEMLNIIGAPAHLPAPRPVAELVEEWPEGHKYSWDPEARSFANQINGLLEVRHKASWVLTQMDPSGCVGDVATQRALNLVIDRANEALEAARVDGLTRRARWIAYSGAMQAMLVSRRGPLPGTRFEDFGLPEDIVNMASEFSAGLWSSHRTQPRGWTAAGLDDLVARLSTGPHVWMRFKIEFQWTSTIAQVVMESREYEFLDPWTVLACVPSVMARENTGDGKILAYDDGYTLSEVRQAMDIESSNGVASAIAALRAAATV